MHRAGTSQEESVAALAAPARHLARRTGAMMAAAELAGLVDLLPPQRVFEAQASHAVAPCMGARRVGAVQVQ
jgi:hypothetical protein